MQTKNQINIALHRKKINRRNQIFDKIKKNIFETRILQFSKFNLLMRFAQRSMKKSSF